MLRFYRLGVAILVDSKRALQLPSLHGRSGRKGITTADLSNLLQEWVSKKFSHECAQKVTFSFTRSVLLGANVQTSLSAIYTLDEFLQQNNLQITKHIRPCIKCKSKCMGEGYMARLLTSGPSYTK